MGNYVWLYIYSRKYDFINKFLSKAQILSRLEEKTRGLNIKIEFRKGFQQLYLRNKSRFISYKDKDLLSSYYNGNVIADANINYLKKL